MDAAGYPSMSGHGVIAAATIAIERGLIFSREFDTSEALIVLDTPAGLVRAKARLIAHGDARRVDVVTMTNVPAFVHAASEVVKVGTRQLRVDVAFGGVFFAIVDTEATGIPLIARAAARSPATGPRHLFGADHARSCPCIRPIRNSPGIGGVIFTGPPRILRPIFAT